MALDLPSHEHAISAIKVDETNLTVRFVDDYHVGPKAAALELEAQNVANCSSVVAYLRQVQEDNDYVPARSYLPTSIFSA